MRNFFQWSQAFETGFEQVDGQHRVLIDMINAAMPVIAKHDSVTIPEAARMLAELETYARQHFDDEERLMASHGLAQAFVAEHLAQHREFEREVAALRMAAASDRVDAIRLLQFLISWLTNHIVGTDKRMAAQIRDIEAGYSAADALQRATPPQKSFN